MVVVPPGDFKMGSKTIYEKPVHLATLSNAFAIGRREVTFDEWDLCVTDGGATSGPVMQDGAAATGLLWMLSWTDAGRSPSAGCRASTGKSYRLPTEAEWEYAARAGTETAFWWGRALVKGNANCEDCGDGPQRKTLPVQSFRPNGFGLFDVAGKCRGMGRGLLERHVSGRPRQRHGVDHRAMRAARAARRIVRQPLDVCQIIRTFPI